MSRRHPSATLTDPLFPFSTLFWSPRSLASRDRPRRRGGRGIAALRRSPVRRPRRPDDRASRRARGAERRRYRGDRGVVEEAQVMSAAMLLQAWGDTLLTTGLLVAALLLIRKPFARAFAPGPT